MSAYRVVMQAVNDPSLHYARDVEAETMCEAIEAVALLVREAHEGAYEPAEARRIPRPMLHPVDAEELGGTPV